MDKTPEQQAAELLPCVYADYPSGLYCGKIDHFSRCPAHHRSAVAAALAVKDAEIERLNKALDETVGERDHWEDVIEQLSTVADCTQEWSNQHEHGPCVEEAIAKLRSQLAVYEDRKFPVIGKGPSSVPWLWVMKHENSCKEQHAGQNVEKLASRGGMSVVELYFAMRDETFPWNTTDWKELERKALEWIATEPWIAQAERKG